jgi:protein-S-isoprenylcysteine O-methyltransferase Ste14
MKNPLRSYLHVLIQFSTLFYIVLSTSSVNNYLFVIVIALGAMLGLWSVWLMRKSVITVFPDPDPKMHLITKGPYKYIRHPMYTALFIILIPLVINQFTYTGLLVLIIFAVNQVLKIFFEEKLLLQSSPSYATYTNSTTRLIPFIF